MEKTVYKIHDRETGVIQGVYSRYCRDETEFSSVSRARSANCHDVYEDKEKFKISKYKVTYELIEDDCE